MSRTSAAAASVLVDGHAENAESANLPGNDPGRSFARDPVEDESDFDPKDPPDAARSSRGHADLRDADAQFDETLEIDEVDDQAASPSPYADSGSRPALVELTDQDLLEGIRVQDEACFAELYNRYFQRIYNFVYSRVRNHAETEEIVQETFLAVFRSFENYRGQSSLLSWIYGIAKNTTNNSLRRAKSQNERIDLAADEDLMPRPSIGVGTPEEQLDLNRFQHHLEQKLGRLADWQTEIFEMRHFENLSIPEISRRTTRSSDAVRSSLYRVKRIFFEAAVAASPVGPEGGSSR